MWLEGSEGYTSSTGSPFFAACFDTSHKGRNSLEDLNSVDRGRSFGREGVGAASDAAGVWGREMEARATLGDGGGTRKWKGTAVGDGVNWGDCIFSSS